MSYEMRDIFTGVMDYNGRSASMMMDALAGPLEAAGQEPFRSMAQNLRAAAGVTDMLTRRRPKPSFGLRQTTIDGQRIDVRDKVVHEDAFCQLRHFERDTGRHDPNVLLVAPMSGHHATLLRGTVETLLPGHNLWITDWKDPRDIPLREGKFGLSEYTVRLQKFLEFIGPETHVIAVCQPTLPVMAAISLMAENGDANQPVSATLMAGPIDTRIGITAVNRMARERSIDWFANNVIETVPLWHPGALREVYPGMTQLQNFMGMNWSIHRDKFRDVYNAIACGDEETTTKLLDFYKEYLAVMDLPAEFFLETVKEGFQDASLPQGRLVINGQTVNPGAIQSTTMLTVEGERDDIVGLGQTESTHRLTSNLDPEEKYHYVDPKAGHYGVFNGTRWQTEIAPRVACVIRASAADRGIHYDPAPVETPVMPPERWDPDANAELRTLHAPKSTRLSVRPAPVLAA